MFPALTLVLALASLAGSQLGNPPASAMMSTGPIDGSTILGPASVVGRLDAEKVDAALADRVNELRYCYQRERVQRPTLAGQLTMSFVIEPDGSVSQAFTAAETLGDPAVEACVQGRLLHMRFPRPRRGEPAVATVSITFTPG